jgi:Chlorophyll A-B binding protein
MNSGNSEDRNSFVFGFSPQAEIWNGRLAMLGFVILLILESATGKGLLARLGIM